MKSQWENKNDIELILLQLISTRSKRGISEFPVEIFSCFLNVNT